MSERGASECRAGADHCITCSDEGIAMVVIELEQGTAVCADPDHERHRVEAELVGPVAPGDQLLVHAGVAIANLGGVR